MQLQVAGGGAGLGGGGVPPGLGAPGLLQHGLPPGLQGQIQFLSYRGVHEKGLLRVCSLYLHYPFIPLHTIS